MKNPIKLDALAPVAKAGAARLQRMLEQLPPGVADELRASARRVGKVRRPRDALRVLETEAGRLSQVIVPLLARHPLPVTTRRAAMTTAAMTAAGAAAIVEIDELAVIFTSGVAAPSLPTVWLALLAAFVVEIWAAVSLRVHQLEAAGRRPDDALLAEEITSALLGIDAAEVGALAGRVAASVGKRVARRWGGALIPGVGMAIDGVAAGRTVGAMHNLPVDGHPKIGSLTVDSWPSVENPTAAASQMPEVGPGATTP
jgi:hypothetical protein